MFKKKWYINKDNGLIIQGKIKKINKNNIISIVKKDKIKLYFNFYIIEREQNIYYVKEGFKTSGNIK